MDRFSKSIRGKERSKFAIANFQLPILTRPQSAIENPQSENDSMADLVSHPDEVKVVSRRFGQGATNIDRYLELDGYKAVQKALAMAPDAIINEVKSSGLRGRGGAGFTTGMKWSFVPKQSAKPKYILCNGDESEPGTCKDRLIFEHDPHSVIEGVMIAGLAVGAHNRLHLHSRRVSLSFRDHAEGACRCLRPRLSGQEHLRQRQRFRHVLARRRRRIRSGRRVRADGVARRQARHSAHPASLPCRGGTLGRADGDQQRRDAGQRAPHYSGRRGVVRRPGHAEKWRHAPVLPQRTPRTSPASTNCPWATTSRR